MNVSVAYCDVNERAPCRSVSDPSCVPFTPCCNSSETLFCLFDYFTGLWYPDILYIPLYIIDLL